MSTETFNFKNPITRVSVIVGLIAIAVLGRFLPHMVNTTPLIAVSLFAGAYLGWREAIGIPIVAMILSDIFIGIYSLPIMLSVYGSFVLVGLLGYALRKEMSVGSSLLAAICGSTLFFIITNFAVWQFGTMYPATLSGLLLSYKMGLPFFKTMLLGDVVYTSILFGIWQYATSYSFGDISMLSAGVTIQKGL